MTEEFSPRTERIGDEDWRTVVRNVPIVSVDLVVVHDGRVALGKRRNRPAKGEWFVPGGRIRKHERLDAAVDRVAREELGVEVAIRERLGAYEHLYHEAELDDVGGKHYIAFGYVVESEEVPTPTDDQHGELELFDELPDGLHEYVRRYFDAADSISSEFEVS